MTEYREAHYIRSYDIQGAPSSETLDQIKTKLLMINPDPVRTVGDAYQEAANALDTAAGRLAGHAERLAGVWRGTTATKALEQIGQINQTAVEMSNKSRMTSGPLQWLGSEEMLGWYRDQGNILGPGAIHTGGDDENAQELMLRLNNRLAEGHNALPEKVVKDLPRSPEEYPGGSGLPTGMPPGAGSPGPIPPGGGPPPGGDLPYSDGYDEYQRWKDGSGRPGPDGGGIPTRPPGPWDGGTGSGPGPWDGGGGPDPYGRDGVPGPSPWDGGGGPGDTELAGFGAGGPFGPGGGGLSAGGAGGGSSFGGGAGSGGFGAGSGGGVPGGGTSGGGAGGTVGVGPGGATSSGFGGGRGGSSAAGTGGRPMAPMGAGGGQGNEEYERSTWLTEDDDVWGGPDPDLPPPVIGEK